MITTGSKLNDMKEQIKMGLKHSKVWVGEDDNGNIYETATKQEVTERILDIFDEAASMVQEGAAAGRTFERLLKEFCPHISKKEILEKFIQINAEEMRRYNDYEYEDQDDDVEVNTSRFHVIDGGKE